jgi:microcystin-dependent protein
MSNYTKATNFASKDALSTGNPAKVIKGTEIDAEYTAIASAISSKADSNSPTLTGTPLAPTASSGTNTTQIASTAFVATAVAAVFPSGGIIIWSGSSASIPSGWVLCNGSNSTPDLRDRFVVGAGSTYAVGATGGSANAIVVSHTHTGTTTITDPGHKHSVPTDSIGAVDNIALTATAGNDEDFSLTPGTGTATTGITASTSISTTGSSATNANLPPYYALCYIMKT